MRVLIEQDDGRIIEAREIEGVPASADILLFFMNYYIATKDAIQIEESLSARIGKKCIVLSYPIKQVVGISRTDSLS